MPGDLANAVPGLAGIAGALLFPTFGAWLKVLIDVLQWDRSPFAGPRRLSGLKFLKAFALTFTLAFILFAGLRAAGDLRAMQPGASVIGPALRGFAIGASLWAIYAVALSSLRKESRRRRGIRGWR